MAKRINGVDMNAVVTAVEKIERKHGVCHPAMLVDAARSSASPIHNLFEWDDSEAANHWRVEQARRVIRSIRVVVEGTEQVAPAFVHVTHVTKAGVTQGYMSTARALAGPTRDGVLRDALSQLNGLRRRYAQLDELHTLWAALDEIEEKAAA